MPLDELNATTDARSKLAKYGKTIKDAATFYLDHLKRIYVQNEPAIDDVEGALGWLGIEDVATSIMPEVFT